MVAFEAETRKENVTTLYADREVEIEYFYYSNTWFIRDRSQVKADRVGERGNT